MATETVGEKEPRAVAVNVLKGGFGKSTTAINLARELAERNERVLLIDLDDNGHTTFNLGHQDQYEAENHLQQVLIDGEDPIDHVVSITDNLDLLPSHESLEDVETNLKSAMASSQRLHRNVIDPPWRYLLIYRCRHARKPRETKRQRTVRHEESDHSTAARERLGIGYHPNE